MTELTLQDGMTIKGTLGHACKVSIADGAHIGLWEASILGENNSSYSWAGLTCLGDATIRLRYGSSTIRGFYDEYPGIYVPEGSTLTIEGTPGQQLIASSNGYAAGIGGGWYLSCGSIVVNGGKVIARGWQSSSGNSSAVYTDATVQLYLDEYQYLRCITTNYPAWLLQKTKDL